MGIFSVGDVVRNLEPNNEFLAKLEAQIRLEAVALDKLRLQAIIDEKLMVECLSVEKLRLEFEIMKWKKANDIPLV